MILRYKIIDLIREFARADARVKYDQLKEDVRVAHERWQKKINERNKNL